MRYDELFEFEPIETVIQVNEADSHDRALELVRTFVISDRMADALTSVVLPNLQFDEPADNKGVLVVGNYGTGKSHLMSVISALCQYGDASAGVSNAAVAEAAKPLSGRFQVVRTEIGTTKMSLHDILCARLTKALQGLGVDHTFPSVSEVDNSKDSLTEMMAKFTKAHPDQGLLLVVDELLDYLRSRDDQALVLDLTFLRELGEVCKWSRFRIVAGLQESLFDNPRFQYVASNVGRVKDRFEQVRIVRDDVACVVSERLLRKSADRRARIEEHLKQFTPLYDGMAERMDEFVSLFPVHPTYLDVFERLAIAEKREVLKTVSAEMKRLIGQEVPADETGLVSYDSYWEHLRGNPALQAVPEVHEVVAKGEVLENRIQTAFTRPQYRPLALRICHGLAVQRLATDDIHARIGPTAEELRDGLCLNQPHMPESNSDFLGTMVATCLHEILLTMSGQYISHNPDNNQYYLDLRKDIDYDAKVEERAATLSEQQLDRYYFDALTQVMECSDQPPYVPGHKIWAHELEWLDHRVTRRGYLFFGAPNERSTAHPPRDFYLYFLQPFKPPAYTDDKLAEEVFLTLKRPDKDSLDRLKLYAGARELAMQASAAARRVYEDKASEQLKHLTKWLRENMLTAYEVTHQGASRKLAEVLKGQKTGQMAVRDAVNLAGSVCLAACFEERYPGYPVFPSTVTVTSLPPVAQETIRYLVGGQGTTLALGVLDALELIDDGKIRPRASHYAQAVLQKLEAVEANQVVNRKDLMAKEGTFERDAAYRLEPELLVVVLLGLVYNGDIVLSLPGKKLDAASLPEAAQMSVEDLCGFKHIERPKDPPVGVLCDLFGLLGLQEGLVRDPNTRELAVQQLQSKRAQLVEGLVQTKQQVQAGYPWWGGALLTEEQQTEQGQRLGELQVFLERLQPFNTPGKLRNFPFTTADVQAQTANLALLQDLESLKDLLDELAPLATYLSTAQEVLPQDDPWCDQVADVRNEWRPKLTDAAARTASDFRGKVTKALSRARQDYVKRYMELHQRSRLGVSDDAKKAKLLSDPRLTNLGRLASVSLLPHANLTTLQTRIAGLRSCLALVNTDLNAIPVCPHCSFRPAQEDTVGNAAVVLSQMDEAVDRLAEEWTRSLLENLADPTAQQSIGLLTGKQKKAVQGFIGEGALPATVSNELAQGIQNALSGLEPVAVTPDALVEALADVGAPCTVDQFRTRFDEFVQELTKGKDPSKLRIVVQRQGPET